MAASLALEPKLALQVRLRAMDRVLPAEIAEQGAETHLVLGPSAAGLRSPHFSLGVDVEAFDGPRRFAAESVGVLGFDPETRLLRLRGSLELLEAPRRAGFRERVEVPVRVLPADGQPLGAPLGAAAVSGESLDIGGGGARIVTRRPLEVDAGQIVRVELDLDGHRMQAEAKVAWIERRGSGRCTAGLAFTEMASGGGDILFRFLFARQRARR